MKSYTEGDLVAVFGGEIGKDTNTADSVTLCKILIVGQKDLLVEYATSYSSTYHTVPKSICFKLFLDPKTLESSKILKPQIGDLVVALTRGLVPGESNKISGILYKVTYKLGQPDRCDVLCGTEMVSVDWNKLMVLRREKQP